MKNDTNELQQQPTSGKEYKELGVILNDKGLVLPLKHRGKGLRTG